MIIHKKILLYSLLAGLAFVASKSWTMESQAGAHLLRLRDRSRNLDTPNKEYLVQLITKACELDGQTRKIAVEEGKPPTSLAGTLSQNTGISQKNRDELRRIIEETLKLKAETMKALGLEYYSGR